MHNYKLTIQYNGKNFAGWQIQENADTVQEKITDALSMLTKENINLIGSGRTDSGVHAIEQVANFRCGKKIDKQKVLYSLNGILGKDISIRTIEEVDLDFHARFSAKRRSYIYLVTNYKSPFFSEYSYFVSWLTDDHLEKLNVVSKMFLGVHDFTSFSKKNAENKSHDCEIYFTHWKKVSDLFVFMIEADRYLHGLVRAITGTILYAVEKNLDENYIQEIFQKKDREAAAMSAPAKGLFLYKVKY